MHTSHPGMVDQEVFATGTLESPAGDFAGQIAAPWPSACRGSRPHALPLHKLAHAAAHQENTYFLSHESIPSSSTGTHVFV